jgi:hypothetical protein
MDLEGMGWEDVGWVHLAQDRDQWWIYEYSSNKLYGYKKKVGNIFIIKGLCSIDLFNNVLVNYVDRWSLKCW